MESTLSEYLAQQTLRPEVFRLFSEVVQDVWHTREVRSRQVATKLKGRLEEIKRRQDLLVSAHVYEKSIDQQTYQEQRARLPDDERMVSTESVGLDNRGPDLNSVLNFAETILTDLPQCWNRLSVQQGSAFLKALYDSGHEKIPIGGH